MADDRSKLARSETMRRVRGRGTSCEIALRDALRAEGVRLPAGRRRNTPGTPDLLFTRWRVAVFVDGCFWHGCAAHCRMPSTNRAYWRAKIARNMARDRRVTRELRRDGWRVVRIWEHETRKRPAAAARRVARMIRSA